MPVSIDKIRLPCDLKERLLATGEGQRQLEELGIGFAVDPRSFGGWMPIVLTNPVFEGVAVLTDGVVLQSAVLRRQAQIEKMLLREHAHPLFLKKASSARSELESLRKNLRNWRRRKVPNVTQIAKVEKKIEAALAEVEDWTRSAESLLD